MTLKPGIWFVTGRNGSQMIPVTREGWMVTLGFVAGMFGLAAIAMALAFSGVEPRWLWVPVFAIGAAADGIAFILIARAHTDFSLTYDAVMRARAKGRE